MLNSEIKAAMRTFYREKSYALINLSGLALAIACCLILGLYLRSELTYDRHHSRHKQIFRVVDEYTTSGNSARCAVTPIPLGPMLKEYYPDVKDFVRFARTGRLLIRSGDKALYWDDVYQADESVFDIFTHKILYGDPRTALKDPSSAAVSETFAKRYFGDANPIGKTIHAELAPEIARKITLVYRDLPENSHLKYSALFRIGDSASGEDRRPIDLFNIGLYTYLLMPENYNISDFKALSDSFFSRFMQDLGKTLGQTWKCWLEPLSDIHLNSDVSYDLPRGNRYYVFGFAAVAVVLLAMACINYVNLAIARAAKRAKEIGMRKILGVPRGSLMLRFLGEAMIFSVAAVFLGAAMVELALKFTPVNELMGKPLALGLKDEPMLLAWMLGLALVVGLISGLYPAFYLSSISPLSALASSYGGMKGKFRLREFLVLTQFTIAIAVIACTLIMAMQMRYISRKDLGFDKQNKVIVQLRGLDLIEKYPVIKNDLLKDSRIKGVSVSDGVIGMEQYSILNSIADGEDGSPGRIILSNMSVGEDFLEAMGMQLVSGRSFSKKLLTDIGNTFVVNETLVRNRGWKNPLGKHIQMGSSLHGRVIGVVKDFHAKSLHSPVEPFVIYQQDNNFQNVPAQVRSAYQRVMVVSITGREVPQVLNFLQEKLAGYDPRHPFEYKFLDDELGKLYLPEERLMKMIGIFSGICIFIACMGLYGLAAFATEQRSREIGIRKALGASASQIIMMLSRKILWLVLAGSVVASIIAYYAIEEWISGFAYRAGIHPLVFVVSAAAVMAVAFITVALQSYRTARANPALMMRYE